MNFRSIFGLTFFLSVSILSSEWATAQGTVIVKGSIKNTEGDALSGVSISLEKPQKILGVSKANGQFEYSVSIGSTISFSHIGYKPFKKQVKSGETLDVILQQKVSNLMDEVVVQGFKQAAREVSTGSTTIVSGKDIEGIPLANVMEALQGRVAGLNIQNNTGSPGAMGTINLRGLSNINISNDGLLTPTSPLFIIDGVLVDANTNYEYGSKVVDQA